MFDCMIIGGGPAGVSTALYLKSKGRDILLLEKRAIGGLAESVSLLTHYTGLLTDESGQHFGVRLRKSLEENDIAYKIEEVVEISHDKTFTVRSEKATYEAKSLVLAIGNERLVPSVPGKEAFTPYAREITEKTDRIAVVAGGSDGACKEAIYLSKYCPEVHIVEKRDGIFCVDQFRKMIESRENIHFHPAREIAEITGNPPEKILLASIKGEEDLVLEGKLLVFAYIGQKPKSDLVKNLLPLKEGYVDSDLQTPVPGLFVAGDCRVKQVRQIATAVADGCLVANRVHAFLG